MKFVTIALILQCRCTYAQRAEKPHIMMVLGDDIGFANVGWNRDEPDPEVQTPNLDGLVVEGIQLTSFYTFKYCGPSRSALMSGRNPIHVNVVNGQTTLYNVNDPVSGYSGIPTNMTTIATKLAGAGYSPHAIGKWDVGMATYTHTPAGRGFESWLGYFGHCNDYWTEIDKCGMGECPSSAATPLADVAMVDMWEQADSGALSRPASTYNNSQSCSQENQAKGCNYEDDVFHTRVVEVLDNHTNANSTKPLFLYWASHACHGPAQVPEATYNKFAFIPDPQRRMYHALLNYLDGMVGDIVNRMKANGMWDNTVMVWSSDNGGPSDANNYPLRGAKFSNFEGGIHVGAFVSGGWLPASRRGIKLGGLATLWDLYATFGHLAGLSDADAVRDDAAAAAGLPPVDSINQWGWWSGAGDASSGTAGGAGGGGSVVLGALPVPPRAELAIGAAYGNGHGASNSFLATTVEGLIQGEMKLILTPPAFPILEAAWSGLQFPNASTNQTDWDATSLDCSSGCLYNLTNDRSEHNNLAAEHPDTVAKMTARMREINATAFSPQRGASSPLGCEVALDTYGGFWGPFIFPGPPPPPPPPSPPYDKVCADEMAAVCPLSNFREYAACRACLKAVITSTPAKVAGCMPAAPNHFKEYCCSKFPSHDPAVNCSTP